MAFNVGSFIFGGDSDVHQSLKLPAKQYMPTSTVSKEGGLTLVFAHGVGLHKEHWEPVIENILGDKELQVREAWSLELQSHGEGGVINEEYLESRETAVSLTEWASAMAQFIKLKGLNPRRTVAIGYSAGACAMSLITKDFPVDDPPFAALVLIEPVMLPRQVLEKNLTERNGLISKMLTRTMSSRGIVWETKEDALSWMMKRSPWKTWDPRAVKLYVDHGLRNTTINGTPLVKVVCTKKQESEPYSDWEPHIAAMEQCVRLHRRLPIHIIFGEQNEYIPEYLQEAITDQFQGGCTPTSVYKILGSGHMMPQEKPDELGQAVRSVLIGLKAVGAKPKL